MSPRRRPWTRLRGRLPMPLSHVVPVVHDDPEPVVRRRRRVVTGTALLGAGLLGVSLSSPPGSKRFYGSSLGVAGIWLLGGAASGPLHLGYIQSQDQQLRRPVLTPVLTGVGAFGFFYAGALAVRRIRRLDEAISSVLQFAEHGNGPLLVLTTGANGIGEEVFFRGALYTALHSRWGPQRAVTVSTAVYALTTTTTRNPALVLAAVTMGTLFGLQRRASGGLQAPVLTHLTWSTLMVRYLPPLFRAARPR